LSPEQTAAFLKCCICWMLLPTHCVGLLVLV
jgi:hypothetical protein